MISFSIVAGLPSFSKYCIVRVIFNNFNSANILLSAQALKLPISLMNTRGNFRIRKSAKSFFSEKNALARRRLYLLVYCVSEILIDLHIIRKL